MRVRNLFVLGIFLFIILVNLNSIKALTYNCEFRSLSTCTAGSGFPNIVFKASAATNAHGEIYSGASYTSANGGYGLCCNFLTSRPATCNSDGPDNYNYVDNRTIILSSTTNAHAESPQPVSVTYSTPVCYGNLECVQVSNNCPPDYPIDTYSISNQTNAHIGKFNSYPLYNICCRNPAEPPPGQTCLQQNGDICTVNEICSGTWLPATDTGSCCSVNCCTPKSQAQACSGVACGVVSDGCGGIVTCTNSCTGQYQCQGNSCVCVPDLSVCQNYECGSFPNGCGGTVSCGTCNSTSSCDGNGICVPSGPGPCILTSAYWSDSQVTNGTSVTLSVTATGSCSGEAVNFTIYEEDTSVFLIDDFILTKTANFPSTTWTAVWTYTANMYSPGSPAANDDDTGSGPRSYYFKAKLVSGGGTLQSSNLDVSSSGVSPPQCQGITTCNSYNDSASCAADSCNKSCSSGVACGGSCPGPDHNENVRCVWSGSSCQVASDVISCSSGSVCGNGIREAGEQCDGLDLRNPAGQNFTCTNFDEYSGGTLLCDSNCMLNFTQCTGYSCNNNGTREPGEACDGNNLSKPGGGSWSCTDFDDFTGGPLSCTSTCQFNTSQCTFNPGSGSTGVSLGTCVYNTDSVIDCEDPNSNGIYTASYHGSWTWATNYSSQALCEATNGAGKCVEDPAGSWHYSPTGLTPKVNCETPGENTIECPAQVRLPFFGNLQFIITLLVIGLIYAMLRLEKKKKM